MRLRACLGFAVLALAGCATLPEGVVVDLGNRTIQVGPCRCTLPPANSPPPQPTAEVDDELGR